MRIYIYIVAIIMPLSIKAQNAFHNFANVQIHTNAKVGFHTDIINDGNFDDNQGLVGLYSDSETRVISGSNKAIFFDVEIDAVNDLELQTSLGITNDLSFINGKVLTDKNNIAVSLDFIQHNIYAGEGNDTHIDGYNSVTGTNEYTFPIGDDNRLRTMTVPSQTKNSSFKGAYFYEDPNSPTTFGSSFLTDQKQAFIENINENEFWDLDGIDETTVTLTWDTLSDIPTISNNIDDLRVVGWNNVIKKWVDLGKTNVTGDLTKGKITSNNFIPNDYEVITIGSGLSSGNLADVNKIITPNNGDAKNEKLVFKGLEKYNKSYLEVYNRWGNLVYKSIDYKNDWQGKSIGRATIKASDDLPVGTYFYLLKFGNSNLSKKQKGWVYIHR